MALLGASFGFIVSGGVFTVLISVGLIPRFAGKMHIAKHIFLLEEMVVLVRWPAIF
jgi:stage V sporulation protein AB